MSVLNTNNNSTLAPYNMNAAGGALKRRKSKRSKPSKRSRKSRKTRSKTRKTRKNKRPSKKHNVVFGNSKEVRNQLEELQRLESEILNRQNIEQRLRRELLSQPSAKAQSAKAQSASTKVKKQSTAQIKQSIKQSLARERSSIAKLKSSIARLKIAVSSLKRRKPMSTAIKPMSVAIKPIYRKPISIYRKPTSIKTTSVAPVISEQDIENIEPIATVAEPYVSSESVIMPVYSKPPSYSNSLPPSYSLDTITALEPNANANTNAFDATDTEPFALEPATENENNIAYGNEEDLSGRNTA